MSIKTIVLALVGFIVLAILPGCRYAVPYVAEDCRYEDIYTIDCGKDLIADYPALNRDGTVNAVVEIPAGTLEKWEVNATLEDGTKPRDGRLRWEFKQGKPRVVHYLAYPVNYGLVPRTKGGDGDALDIILLGSAVSRGSIVAARCIGALLMTDGGDVDDKIVGVMPGSPFAEVNDINELDRKFPGVKRILETWFLHYKGPGEMVHRGWGDRQVAEAVIQAAVEQN